MNVRGGSLYLQKQVCAPKRTLAMSSAIVTTCGAKKGVKSSFSGSGSAAIRKTRARVRLGGWELAQRYHTNVRSMGMLGEVRLVLLQAEMQNRCAQKVRVYGQRT